MHPDTTLAMATGLLVLAALYLLIRLRSGKGEKMLFIVYEETPFSGSLHQILRWGTAPEDQIALQAGDGEVAIPAPVDWSPPEPGQGAGYYNPTDGDTGPIFVPPPSYDTDEDRARARALIIERLRLTDWTQLPDAPLTSGEVAEFATYRAELRSVVLEPDLGGFGITWDFAAPPYQEI